MSRSKKEWASMWFHVGIADYEQKITFEEAWEQYLEDIKTDKSIILEVE